MYTTFSTPAIEHLWTSKSLDLLWLSACGHWHSPVLFRGRNQGWVWFYRVDVSVGAWATRTLTRAREAGASLPGEPEKALATIRAYLDELNPGCLVEVDRLAASPVILPGADLLATASEFARFGMVPEFEGMTAATPPLYPPVDTRTSDGPARGRKATAVATKVSRRGLFD